MSTETKYHLAEKFRQNWQSQYPYSARSDNRQYQPNVLKHNNTGISTTTPEIVSESTHIIDDSLTNLNWLQNLNLFSLSHGQSPLSPIPYVHSQTTQSILTSPASPGYNPGRFAHPFFESNALYAEVAQNLEFMKEEASAHFFKVNNQLRPPFSDINLISMAIYSYNKSKVSFPEICQWIEETFPYYKIINQDWKVGVKNHLTLSKCFQKVPRRKDDIEKGGFWRFSNDFLGYLEKTRLMGRNLNEIMFNAQRENGNHIEYRFGKLISRKRTLSSSGAQDENRNSAFKIPNKRPNLCDNDISFTAGNFDSVVERSLSCDTTRALIMRSEEAMYRVCNPHVTSTETVTLMSNVTATNNVLEHQLYQQVHLVAPTPEQETEQEFLSGRLFSGHNHMNTSSYLTSQSNMENMPTLLDTQVNLSLSDFSINDLSITGVGIRPPEWWNQSLSASQISISKLSCSLRSLASLGNAERGSPFQEEDHHVNWHSDQNLEELDILFGLS